VKGEEKNEIVVFTHKGEEARAAFLDTWEQLEEKNSVGVSLRWAVVAGDDDKMKAQLQAMPAPASLLSDKPTMRADNIPIIKLLELPVSCDMFDRDSMAGPFPTLFAENKSAMMEALQENVGLVPRPAEAGQAVLLPRVCPPKGGSRHCCLPKGGDESVPL
jgi:hypothetical protein